MARRTHKSPRRWALQDAKNRFSEVVDAAVRGEPQIVTKRGEEAAVVLGHADYARLVAARDAGPSLGQYLVAGSPTAKGEPLERIRLRVRDEID
jgi:prevent-host-death family protein